MRVVVAGMVAGDAHQGGATWAVMQYVLGLRELGHDALLVEPTTAERLADPVVARYFEAVASAFAMRGRSALVAGKASLGLPYDQIRQFADRADVVLNLSGLLRDPALLQSSPVRVYMDLDPAFTQLWHTVEGIDMGFDGHTHFVTVGLEVGTPDCEVPTCGRDWLPTVPPVVLSEWPSGSTAELSAFTTVANWRSYGSIRDGDRFYGQKAHSFRELLALPHRTGEWFAPALTIDPGDGDDLLALRACGWDVRDAGKDAATPEAYRRFVQSSSAELGVAKSGYVTSRCGWFSDRSAAYLASGRPVLAQDTGFSEHLTVGEGLLAFDDLDSAADGVASIRRRYDEHAAAARALAESHFDSRIVLGRLLEEVCG